MEQWLVKATVINLSKWEHQRVNLNLRLFWPFYYQFYFIYTITIGQDRWQLVVRLSPIFHVIPHVLTSWYCFQLIQMESMKQINQLKYCLELRSYFLEQHRTALKHQIKSLQTFAYLKTCINHWLWEAKRQILSCLLTVRFLPEKCRNRQPAVHSRQPSCIFTILALIFFV